MKNKMVANLSFCTFLMIFYIFCRTTIADLNLSKATLMPKPTAVADVKVSKNTVSTLSEAATNICENDTTEMCDETTETFENVTLLESVGFTETPTKTTKIQTVLANVTLPMNTSRPINGTNLVNTTTPEASKPTNESNITSINIAKSVKNLNLEFLQVSEEDCHCDLLKDVCDLNCCCDRNCSTEDRAVFSHCIKSEEHHKSHHCMSKYMMYLNNTQYQVMENQIGLFCIVVDNMPVRFEYSKHSALKSVKDFNKLWRRHMYYDWHLHEPNVKSFRGNEVYKYGRPVWIIRNTSLVPLVLPTQIVSSLCQGEIQVKFLKEFNSSCLRRIPKSKAECQQLDLVSHDRVVSSLNLLNISLYENCSEEICLPMKKFVCFESEDYEKCNEQNITFSLFNSSSHSCNNLIRSLHYVIYHNGTQGISEVKVFVQVFNTSTKMEGMFRQHFKVTFEWLRSDNETGFQRSGHPGYLVGRPIISANQISKIDNEMENKTLDISAFSKDWLSLSVANGEGNCDGKNRVNIMFGYNFHTRCTLKVAGDCQHMQAMIWHQLIGRNMNKTNNMYISSYGDPHLNNLEDWVPLLQDLQYDTSQLVTHIKIKIVSTNVGSASNPQAKIIGVHLQPVYIDCEATNRPTTVSIISSVIFIDITKPPLTIFAQPPVYEIKLPKDFFYPFLSKSAPKRVNFCVILVQLVLVCICQNIISPF